ncbi:DNA-binding protein [Paenibacillus pinisoli]|uniref:DNA-binding protein n=2 Tax=Paenibacillus pinisoli TaxID=1276110 RepID=A0A3A6PIG6_9BACL|nr:DNA-binding protein [Paenibacillus pinisoli]
MSSVEKAIRSIVDEVVAEAERRILEQIRLQPDKTMDIRETTEHLGVSEKLLYRLCQAKSIPHERYGVSGSKRPTIKFRLSDLEKWRSKQRSLNYVD